MLVAAPDRRPAARERRAAAYALAALALVVAFVGATLERWTPAHVVAIGAQPRSVAIAKITRSPAKTADPRAPLARLATDGPDEKADLGGRAPTPTSVVRPRGDGGWDGRLPECFGLDPAARGLAPAATAALDDCASAARIAALHERARRITPPREPNPARGPPRT
jgi:hypothetical protein